MVWSALALPGAAERARLDGSGLASSTYHAARRRAYDERWVRDRYVPDPVAIGRPVITFLLGRPYAEELAAVGRRWAATDGAAVVWTGTPMALGIFFHPNAAIAHRAIDRLRAVLPIRDAASWSVDLSQGRVPVYFDFEGAWARFAGVTTPGSYPFGLGYGAGASLEDAAPRRPLPDRLRSHALAMLEGPFGTPEGGLTRWFAAAGLDRRERELLEAGYLQPRSFLEPAMVPDYRGRRMDQILLVTGEMRDRTDPTVLLSELRTSFHTSPFLFVHDGPRVLLGLLGHAGPPAPSAPTSDSPSAPVGTLLRETVGRWLCRVDLFREEAHALRAVLDHRYGPLLQPGAASGMVPARVRAPALRR